MTDRTGFGAQDPRAYFPLSLFALVGSKALTQGRSDAEINEEIEGWDKSFAKFKKSRLHSDNESYKKARNKVQLMIKNKKTNLNFGNR